jgi:hypothetical protein
MGTGLQITEVFTPSDFPSVTYVTRNDRKLETRLQQAIATPGEVVSSPHVQCRIPSKSVRTKERLK